ncbi:MAG TPA: helix-turn-helix transcriptional regulator [Candidatus Scatomorpha pullicola]|nr:helix-turn-helix transcriptional regulator [Candidatus Scatomorpha pullicola]
MDKRAMGSFIAALRRAKGLTQRELAELLNVSDKAVSRWERGDAAPDLSVIPALAELFGVTADELLRGERRPDLGEGFSRLGAVRREWLIKSAMTKFNIRNTDGYLAGSRAVRICRALGVPCEARNGLPALGLSGLDTGRAGVYSSRRRAGCVSHGSIFRRGCAGAQRGCARLPPEDVSQLLRAAAGRADRAGRGRGLAAAVHNLREQRDSLRRACCRRPRAHHRGHRGGLRIFGAGSDPVPRLTRGGVDAIMGVYKYMKENQHAFCLLSQVLHLRQGARLAQRPGA